MNDDVEQTNEGLHTLTFLAGDVLRTSDRTLTARIDERRGDERREVLERIEIRSGYTSAATPILPALHHGAASCSCQTGRVATAINWFFLPPPVWLAARAAVGSAFCTAKDGPSCGLCHHHRVAHRRARRAAVHRRRASRVLQPLVYPPGRAKGDSIARRGGWCRQYFMAAEAPARGARI